ncbi:MAG: flagellar hook-basal body complex protein [Planctomycetota bacterium]|jgi:flagellar hook protein FlgE
MALIRALNAAISGLRGQQFRIDTIGDNLANSTTTAFKAGRVEFHTLLSQTIQFGTAPQGFLGGIDPLQRGLGVGIASTTRMFTQGELDVTGIASDLGIQGEGFFIMRDNGGDLVFSRDGSFSLNPSNLLHNPANGYIVQGVMADRNTFTIASGAPIQNIEVPVGELQLAVATGSAQFDGNLNGGGDQALMGTIMESNIMVDLTTGLPATGATLLTNLGRRPETPGPDIDLALDPGDVIYVQGKKGARTLPQMSFYVGSTLPPGFDGNGTTLQQYLDFVERALGINPGGSDILVSGIRDNDNDPNTAGVTGSATAFTQNVSGQITAVTMDGINFVTDGVKIGDVIRFNTGAGAGQIATIAGFATVGATANDTMVLSSPLASTLPQPSVGDQFSIHERPDVVVSDGVSTGSPSAAGRIRIAGNVGTANHITDLEMTSSDGTNLTTFFTREQATGESIISNVTVYDSDGNSHLVEVTYVLETKGGVDPVTTSPGNVWRFLAESQDSNLVTGGVLQGSERTVGTGTIAFTTGGQFLSQNPSAAFSLAIPNQGAATPLNISPDFAGITGFANHSSAVFVTDQDGFPTGVLMDYSVGEDGIITGIFSNGITRPLGQIYLARFNNPNGLELLAESNFRQAANSGIAIIGQPSTLSLGRIQGGVLEASNVDFAQEFTSLIVSQRAFQANARVITTADDLLEELVNIV